MYKFKDFETKKGVQIQGLWKIKMYKFKDFEKKNRCTNSRALNSDLNAVHALISLFLVLYHVILTVGQHGNVNILN